MFASIRLVAFAFILPLAWPALGATGAVEIETAPGTAAAVATTKGSGTIKAIDANTRTVTILGDGGTELSFVAGPDVKNFAQLAVGQRVNAEYVQALTLELKPGSTEPVSRTIEGDTGAAAEGKLPAGMIRQRIRIVAEVTAVNQETKTVTLKGPERTVDLKLDDPEQVARVKVGDRVEAVYVEATAIAVSPAK
jgi:Cu/Ag efflux protein CusF